MAEEKNTEEGQPSIDHRPQQEEELLNDPSIEETASSTEPVAETEQPITYNPQPITNEMETHAQELHKAPGHGWKHYFFEFFMLFLAVFCGFLAENFREHIVEKEREKQYMESLISDIREDTSEIKKSIISAEKTMAYEDSVLFYLYKNPPVDFLTDKFLDIDYNALVRLKIVLNEATAQQLKNSGNMRLIRDQALTKEISLYWNEQGNTKISLERYLEYRNRGREFAEKLFVFSDNDLVKAGLIKPSAKGVRIIQSNPALWSEYSNIISHCHINVDNYLKQLNKLLEKAGHLINFIRKEYRLE